MKDVAIIGLGPVGGVLASLLADLGVSVVVIERSRQVYPLPRAVHFDAECMRVFQTIGIADELAKHCHVSPGMRFVNAEGRLLLDWKRPVGVGPQGWYASYRFHQPDLEKLLRQALDSRLGVQQLHGCEVYAIDETAEYSTVRYEDTSTGELHTLQAHYVVGCDGARSLVRKLIGASMKDLGLHEQWLVFDALLKRPWSKLGDYSLQFCDPQRPATYIRGIGQRRRWEIMLLPGDDPIRMVDPKNIWSLVEKWITPDDADIERGTVYTFHSVIARRWRKGRLLIAGDAAHQIPPFLGQGMCAGIRDAANLAWKLQAVLSGRMSDALLDTYQQERSPHVEAYIELAVRLGRLIQATDVAAAMERDSQFATGPKEMHSISPLLGSSSLNDRLMGAGSLSPQCVEGGLLFDDRIGQSFLLVAIAGSASVEPILSRMSTLARVEVLMAEPGSEMANWLERSGFVYAMVRPDRYVLGGAQDLDGLGAQWQHIERYAAQVARCA